MNRTRTLFGAAVALTLSFSAWTTQAQNILVDPGFETQDGWTLFSGAAYSQAYAHTGSWSMYDSAVNNVPGSFEAFPASAGQEYDLTGYGLTPAPLLGSPAFGIIQLTFFSGPDATGNNLGTVLAGSGNAQTSAQINGGTTPGVWTFLDTGIATAPAGTESIAAYTIYVDFSGNNQGVYFDDLSLTQVPEASTLVLIGAGLLVLAVGFKRISS